MPGRITRSRSVDSPDPANTMLEADKMIRKLKKDREDNIRVVMTATQAALAEFNERLASRQREFQQQREKRRLDCLTELLEIADRKAAIEDKMGSISAKAHAEAQELEAMMMAGYEGRAKDATLALDKMTGKPMEEKQE
ncbi:hypothetical protein M419DRAFT_4529 [Trichoderma reesei RUT C-30]|uniref:Uncharacterized protein n=1 Tax=Hypocrea jecorina (strain ATCC 56765 / BCRC 32924 / NRRL 11460 / Rut C-30) TaxID=1344414 RepID=A0A024SMM6_HYPJR|nr:hypothetical protein M419DRAFT_4529 [Trichoderma reesei RUT C-30]